jgi:hypothetical protein
MPLYRDPSLFNQAKTAVESIRRQHPYGAFRVKDPEGSIYLWAIESSPREQFSISFVDKGRVYSRVEELPQDFLKSFLEYVRKNAQ